MVWIGFKFALGVLLFLVALYVALSVGAFLLVKLGEWYEVRDNARFQKMLEEERKQKREEEEKQK